jgi:hypothetical protein
MNIKEAKEQIKNAMTAYFSKDEFGRYEIPMHKQRPVCMIGPPGIGKTAVMEQIASELGVGLVAYSMTHHTRQSALGLPYITDKVYGGKNYKVSEYTMSEIIASVYNLMKDTGIKEGILFLDEINCVSETLSPCMLQFLQYKYFGTHRLPAGWIVVTAGNPPEYNKSVRDFDIVTWDRLKRIDVEPDYGVWKEYAGKNRIHASVTTYLSARTNDFYKVETTAEGKSFVTARGWDDLSQMIELCEKKGIAVDGKLFAQYLQNKKIARDFSVYYDLFNKYKSDYQIEHILDGNVSDAIIFRAENAKFDERMSLLGLIFDAVSVGAGDAIELEDVLWALKNVIADLNATMENTADGKNVIASYAEKRQAELDNKIRAYAISLSAQKTELHLMRFLENSGSVADIKAAYNSALERLKASVSEAGKKLENVFSFLEKAFGEGEEILMFVTELTADYHCAKFIGHYGCEKYYEHNESLQFYERQKSVSRQIDDLFKEAFV